jgi:hypothetical protein
VHVEGSAYRIKEATTTPKTRFLALKSYTGVACNGQNCEPSLSPILGYEIGVEWGEKRVCRYFTSLLHLMLLSTDRASLSTIYGRTLSIAINGTAFLNDIVCSCYSHVFLLKTSSSSVSYFLPQTSLKFSTVSHNSIRPAGPDELQHFNATST